MYSSGIRVVLLDALIFNSIEFWGGQNPVAMKAGDVEEGQVMYAGHPYHVTKSLNKMVVASEETDAVADSNISQKKNLGI